MTILLMLQLLLGNFVLKESIPYGTSGPNGRVLLGDFNRNSKTDVIFTGYSGTFALSMIFERQDSGIYVLMDTVGFYHAVWDAGDFDADSLYDLVTDGDYFIGVTIYESPNPFAYPTQEVWRDTVGQALVTPICAYDIDQDDLQEIVKEGANGIDFVIYESIANNLYARVYEDTIQGILTPTSTIAFGDFDEDNKIEFVLGNLSDGVGAAYWLYESPADNTYEFIHLGSLPTKNIKDCFSVPDADGDGKLEFVVKGYVTPSAQIHAFIFEATGDNTYEIIKTFTLPGGDYYGGYSDVGDVDGDSIPEIALEGRQTVHIIKAAGNDSFYVWETLPGNNSGSSVRVFDVDGNGLAEVIISGNNQTRIYEYEVGVAENIPSEMQLMGLTVSPNPIRDQTIIRYSFHEADYKMQNPTLKIYDVSGRLVKDFNLGLSIRNHLSAIFWQGDDDTGRKLPGGVYFLTLAARDYSATEKLLLIR